MLEDVICHWGGHEVSPMEVYTEMFHLGDGLIQKDGEASGEFKANPLGYWKNDKDDKGHYRIMFEDTFEETLTELQNADFSIINGLTYFGRKNIMERASKMYAMIFDLDGVTEDTLSSFFSGCFRAKAYPTPNYVVLSGHGVHLYYLFEYAIPLYPNIKLQLKELKYALTTKMWNMYTSTNEKRQYQGINQGFRAIGGKTKIDGIRAKAFEVNLHPFNLENIGKYVPPEHRVDETKLWKETKLTLDQAKKKYPEWYEKRVLNKQPKGTWTCKRALYDWWLNQIIEGAEVGHRYFCIMCLAIYGVKCGIPKKEVKKDAIDLLPYFNGMSAIFPFTKSDIRSALECYDEKYITFPVDDISKLSGILIQKNKRNGRKQSIHMRIMNSTRDILYPDGSWINKNGASTKQDLIVTWVKEHPNGKKIDCQRELNISRPTIIKWWPK